MAAHDGPVASDGVFDLGEQAQGLGFVGCIAAGAEEGERLVEDAFGFLAASGSFRTGDLRVPGRTSGIIR